MDLMQDNSLDCGFAAAVVSEVENFLEPLVFDWDEDDYLVSRAIRSYVAEFLD